MFCSKFIIHYYSYLAKQYKCTSAAGKIKMSVLAQALKTAGLVAVYYCFSITLTFYNKWILTVSSLSRETSFVRVSNVVFDLARTPPHRVTRFPSQLP